VDFSCSIDEKVGIYFCVKTETLSDSETLGIFIYPKKLNI